MRNLFKEKYMGNIIMYEEMLGYVHVHRAIFIVTFLYYTLLSRLKKTSRPASIYDPAKLQKI